MFIAAFSSEGPSLVRAAYLSRLKCYEIPKLTPMVRFHEVSVFKSVIPQEPLAVGASCARDFHWGVTQTITELFF